MLCLLQTVLQTSILAQLTCPNQEIGVEKNEGISKGVDVTCVATIKLFKRNKE